MDTQGQTGRLPQGSARFNSCEERPPTWPWDGREDDHRDVSEDASVHGRDSSLPQRAGRTDDTWAGATTVSEVAQKFFWSAHSP